MNGKVHMYFTAVGLREYGTGPKSTIGMAVSEDGYHFGAPLKVLEQIQLYPVSADYIGYSTPTTLVYDGQVHVFHDVAMWFEHEDSSYVQVALHHALSPDGVTGWVQDKKPIFTRSNFE